MIRHFNRINGLQGTVSLPGDKSISHRALIFASMAKGKSEILNLADGEDVKSTLHCLKQIGADFRYNGNLLIVKGVGYKGFIKPESELNCGNSGTTARLLAGLLAAQNFNSNIIGDASLSNRPMLRVVDPLMMMNAKINASENGTLPLIISASDSLNSIHYELKVPSAQVKSALLIAGLHNQDETTISENVGTRDHTENLLGLKVDKSNNRTKVFSSRNNYPTAKKYFIPGDISSASFLVVIALLTNNSKLVIQNVSLNPTRIKFISVLLKMGADIKYEITGSSNNEVYGSIIVKSSMLKNIRIDESDTAEMIDEIPILAVAGSFADGDFEIRNCKELRYKESDRIKSIVYNMSTAGFDASEFEDGFIISGRYNNNELFFESFDDHRIAMCFAVFAMLAEKGGKVKGFDAVNISNPFFLRQIEKVIKY